VYNAALPDPGQILDTAVERLRTAHDVDVIGAVIAAQVAAPVLRTARRGTLLVTSGGFADDPVPALASLSMGKAALRSAQTLIAAGVRDDGIHAATVTIAGAVKPRTNFDPDNIAELFLDRPHRPQGRLEDVPHPRGNIQVDGDVSRSRCDGEARRVIQQHPARAALHQQWCDPAQTGEQQTKRIARRIGTTRELSDVASEPGSKHGQIAAILGRYCAQQFWGRLSLGLVRHFGARSRVRGCIRNRRLLSR
jgi:NAD(P)-dependent dehydrogenase (short-subunit alcohol dehydrogenase family)